MPQSIATDGGGAPMKETAGGGDPSVALDGAPEPITDDSTGASAPTTGSQPAAPQPQVTGGGQTPVQTSGGGSDATTFGPAPDPVQCGTWVPAPMPTANAPVDAMPPAPVGAPSSTDGSLPGPATPGPVQGPDDAAVATDAPAPALTGTTPASQLPTWPQWQQHLGQLGLGADEVAKIGTAMATDAGLAQIYRQVHAQIQANGGVLPNSAPTDTPTSTVDAPQGTPAVESAWNTNWDAKFAALGIPAALISEIRAEAIRTGASEAKIQQAYDKVVTQLGGAPQPGTAGGEQPGWTNEWAARFTQLGMPEAYVKMYAESGAPAAGLEAAYNHAAGRIQDFADRGWLDKFTALKLPTEEIWGMILADEPQSDEDLKTTYNAYKQKDRSMFNRALQTGVTFFPGGELAQWVAGKKFVSGKEVDRFSPMNLAFAALSGVALFTAFRGVKNLRAGAAAFHGGYQELNKVAETAAQFGLNIGAGKMDDAFMGAIQNKGFLARSRAMIAYGHAESAARSFNANAGNIMNSSAGDGKLLVTAQAQGFADVMSGTAMLTTGKLPFIGALKNFKAANVPAALKGVDEAGRYTIEFTKNMHVGGSGNLQLAALTQAFGAKLTSNPAWLEHAMPGLGEKIAGMGEAQRALLASTMAGSTTSLLGKMHASEGVRASRYINNLAKGGTAPWYEALAQTGAASWKGVALTSEALAIGSEALVHDVLGVTAAAAIAKLDPATVSAKAFTKAKAAGEALAEARAELNRAKAIGSTTPELVPALDKFAVSVDELSAVDTDLTMRLFNDFIDPDVRGEAVLQARTFLQESHAAKVAESLAGTASGVADDTAKLVDDALEGLAPSEFVPTPASELKFTQDPHRAALDAIGMDLPRGTYLQEQAQDARIAAAKLIDDEAQLIRGGGGD